MRGGLSFLAYQVCHTFHALDLTTVLTGWFCCCSQIIAVNTSQKKATIKKRNRKGEKTLTRLQVDESKKLSVHTSEHEQ